MRAIAWPCPRLSAMDLGALTPVERQESAGNLNLENLPELWRQMTQLWGRVQDLQEPPPGPALTARRFDLAQPAGHRVYIGAHRLMECAMDNHRALVGLLSAHGATPWAPWNLLRPSLEAAVLAAWVLEPSDGLTRRRRGLHLELIDNRERVTHWSELEKLPGSRGREIARYAAEAQARVIPVYRAEAEQLGVEFNKAASAGVNIRDAIGQLSIFRSNPDFAVLARATWRSLSGFQHGHGYALMAGSDMTVVAPIQGGQVAHMVVNDERFATSARVVTHVMIEAMRLWIRRSTSV